MFPVLANNNIYNAAVSMKQAFLGHIGGDLAAGALMLACFFAVYILVGVAVRLFSGQQFPWQEVFRPFVIILLITFWSGTLGLFDTIGEHVYDYMDAAMGSNGDSSSGIVASTAAREVLSGMEEELAAKSSPDAAAEEIASKVDGAEGGSAAEGAVKPADGEKKSVGGKIKDFWQNKIRKPVKVYLFTNIIGGLAGFHWLMEIIYSIIRMSLTVLSQMYLTFFALIGPFAFAFGVIPQLNRISQWIASYLQYWLWTPLLSLAHGMTNFLSGHSNNIGDDLLYSSTLGIMGSNAGMDAVMATADNTGGVMNMVLFSSVALIAGIFLLLSIPKIAAAVVNTGSDVLGGKMFGAVGGATSAILRKMLGLL